MISALSRALGHWYTVLATSTDYSIDEFLMKLAHLCDKFEKPNTLNIFLQWKTMHLLMSMEKNSVFIQKKKKKYGEE